ncbi:MAG: BON domain-containing protein [Betaproteobacteria bacterium]
MKRLLAAAAVLALAACGQEAPKPAPVPPQPPQTQVAPAPKPEAKAPEAPKPDPNKELANRVKRALEAANLLGIDPSAADGKVTLWGTTPTDAERKRAATVATKVEGVTSVDNQIKVVKGS